MKATAVINHQPKPQIRAVPASSQKELVLAASDRLCPESLEISGIGAEAPVFRRGSEWSLSVSGSPSGPYPLSRGLLRIRRVNRSSTTKVITAQKNMVCRH